MAFLKIENLRKSFDKLEVLRDVSFTVEQGDVIALIGSSGSGKSTLLRCLIGLESIDGGSVELDSLPYVTGGVYSPPPLQKELTGRMGMVFQSFNLFPHMTVRQNLTEPYIMTSPKATDGKEKCDALLAKVGLSDKAEVYPSKLSGGQQQRVAIARALMKSPEIMLFDEPTSALDPLLTGEVLAIMKKLAEEHMTMLVVTHEMSFARSAATKVLFMKDGRIVEAGTPCEIFENPRDPATKEFLGSIER